MNAKHVFSNSATDIYDGLRRRPWAILNFGVAEKYTPGLGCRYVTAALLNANIQAEYINFSGIEFSFRPIEHLPQNSVVGIHAMAGRPLGRAIAVAQHLRTHLPEACLVWGGPLCASHETAVAKSGLADLVVLGESEPFVASVVSNGPSVGQLSDNNGIPVFRANPPRTLDSLPVLPTIFRPVDLVYPYNRFGDVLSTFDIQLSRGCWGTCAYCYARNIPYRVRPNAHILTELQMMSSVRPAYIRFIDDTFPLTASTIQLLEQWIQTVDQPPIFFCELRLDQLNHEELLRRFVSIGLRDVFVGIESGDQKEIDSFGKHISCARVQDRVSFLKACGVNVFAGLLLNVPGQTPDSLERTLRLATSANASAYYPAFLKDYSSYDSQASLSDVAEEEWLALGYNASINIPDVIFHTALLRLKTLHLVRTALYNCPSTHPANCFLLKAARLTVDNGLLHIATEKINATAISEDGAAVECESCAALLLWAIADCRSLSHLTQYRIATRYLRHSSYHVRALALGAMLELPHTYLTAEADIQRCTLHLREDSHAFVRVFADLLHARLENPI